MEKGNNKYFALIWTTIVVGYTSTLFLLVATLNKEVFKAPAFWLLYAWMMVAFLIWLCAGIFEVGNIKILSTFTYPYLAIVFLVTTILYFRATQIEKLAFIIIPMIIFSAILIIVMLLGMINKKWIQQHTQQLKEIEKVEELYSFFMKASETCSGEWKKIVENLAMKCQTLTSSEDEESKILDQRLIEYAMFIQKNAINKETNIENNIKRFEEILAKRVK